MDKFTDRVSYYDKKAFGAINRYWAKAVNFLRAKEVLAEFLGTFVLVVSEGGLQIVKWWFLYAWYTVVFLCQFSNHYYIHIATGFHLEILVRGGRWVSMAII